MKKLLLRYSFFINICILELNIILWILMIENWVLWHWKLIFVEIYFMVSILHLFYLRLLKNKKKKNHFDVCGVFFFLMLRCEMFVERIISVFRDRINSIRNLGVSSWICWGILSRDLGALSKSRFLEIRSRCLFGSSQLPKLLFVQPVQGLSRAEHHGWQSSPVASCTFLSVLLWLYFVELDQRFEAPHKS